MFSSTPSPLESPTDRVVGRPASNEQAVTDPAHRYRMLDSLGRGGMGEVFLADDTQLERKVALKFLQRSAQASNGADIQQRDPDQVFTPPYTYVLDRANSRLAALMQKQAGSNLTFDP